ncbi:BCCT family transporter [Marinobacter sp. M216]|uniref:BCCT family transporter n=1 Tax=Marinobacter albus TaxID=3030833 RepID=A0ABT7H964_9GAMM|nr:MULTISPECIES: BCCT family transporter [unclassified Marinobacter]MBW7470837.1 BCCT family transporter [Marinobacter sp. F4218]MDK9556893.1 BCCT family transporter [Marinobacter sp. M216]
MGDVAIDDYQTDYVAGQDNIARFGFDIHNIVFPLTALLIVAFVVATLIFPSGAKELLDSAKNGAIAIFDWGFLLSANLFVLFCLALIFMPVGKIRIGGVDAKPEFSMMSWFAMLFAAGMGTGLMFWSVAEPVAYYTDWYGTPLGVEPNTTEGARLAMGATMYHWGLHPWAIYAIVGLSLSFFAYNKGLPLTIRSAFFPILGDKVWGWPGNVIDTVAVLATIFGLATSLGFGAQQAASGLSYLFDIEGGLSAQIGVIAGVTAVATFSVIRGIHGGVRLLSNANMVMAGLLLVFVIFAGPTLAIFNWLWDTTVSYASNMVALSNPFGREEDTTWFHGWTVFYWAWWISWSPFVGMFIARVSRGRTVREFVTAVLIIPTIITVFWMSAFGGSALDQVRNDVGVLASEGLTEVSLAMFQALENISLSGLTSFIGITLVLTFFVTSSDSGSLVIDSITSGGKIDAPKAQRVFWAVTEGSIAGVLLFVGGEQALNALQAGALSVGLPFTLVLLVMSYSLFKGLHHERGLLVAEGKM